MKTQQNNSFPLFYLFFDVICYFREKTINSICCFTFQNTRQLSVRKTFYNVNFYLDLVFQVCFSSRIPLMQLLWIHIEYVQPYNVSTNLWYWYKFSYFFVCFYIKVIEFNFYKRWSYSNSTTLNSVVMVYIFLNNDR